MNCSVRILQIVGESRGTRGQLKSKRADANGSQRAWSKNLEVQEREREKKGGKSSTGF